MKYNFWNRFIFETYMLKKYKTFCNPLCTFKRCQKIAEQNRLDRRWTFLFKKLWTTMIGSQRSAQVRNWTLAVDESLSMPGAHRTSVYLVGSTQGKHFINRGRFQKRRDATSTKGDDNPKPGFNTTLNVWRKGVIDRVGVSVWEALEWSMASELTSLFTRDVAENMSILIENAIAIWVVLEAMKCVTTSSP